LALEAVVVEPTEKSGALITADFALSHGRAVFEDPRNITSLKSRGTDSLIKADAELIYSPKYILEEVLPAYGESLKANKESIETEFDNLKERNIFSLLSL
jgi:predicted Rossmann fold nucleotide-binding protein DprA/Smf involved in DNA uptake